MVRVTEEKLGWHLAAPNRTFTETGELQVIDAVVVRVRDINYPAFQCRGNQEGNVMKLQDDREEEEDPSER